MTSDLFLPQNSSGAEFSKDRKYRYALWRIWNPELPLIMYIGLNPSTASEIKNDRTISVVKTYSNKWGYGGFYMMNLFALVTKKPSVLKKSSNPLGDNDGWLERIAPKCEKIVFAWGAFKEAKERSVQVIKMFPNAFALHINHDGSPHHPLYLKGDIKPVPYAIKPV